MARLLPLVLAGVLVFLGVPHATAGDRATDELHRLLETLSGDQLVSVIVHLSDPPAAEALESWRRSGAARAAGPIREFLAGTQARPAETLWLIHALAVTAPAAVVRELAQRPDVARIDLDRQYVLPRPVSVTKEPQRQRGLAGLTGAAEWNVEMIHAPALWSAGYTGTGIVVATVDSGVDPLHQDLAGRWRGGSNSWYDPNGQHATPYDASGHGTQVMGALVGGSVDGTAIGVAPGARWIGAKIFDDSGVASASDIHRALQWVLDPDGNPATDDAADVVNCSWGLENQVNQCILEFQTDVEALRGAGIAVVFAAGNSGPFAASSMSPANNPERLAVGYVDSGSTIDLSSSRGPSACGGGLYPGLVAPGVDVKTTDLTLGGVFPDSYAWVTGSSIGAPHLTGALALLKQAVPAATIENLEAALAASAADLGAAGPDNLYGRGLIDVAAARARLLDLSFCQDADGDGRSAGGGICGPLDCDDALPTAWATPGEARGLRLEADRRTLTWLPPLDPGGATGAIAYDVLRSPSASDFTTATVCVESGDGSDATADDPVSPTPGQLLHYLIRARSLCPSGAGSLGSGTSGGERPGRACPDSTPTR